MAQCVENGKQIVPGWFNNLDAQHSNGETECHDNQSFYSRSESQAVISRCAVRSVHDVISRFDERKRQFVKDIGFGGLLQLPPLKNLNRKFTVWLMRNVDEVKQCILVGEGKKVPFCKEDVGKIFGIPCVGKRVIDRRNARKERKVSLLKTFPGIDVKEQRSIKVIQEILDRVYDGPMSRMEEDTFKVAFVVFVMSCLLAPCAKHDYATAEYWDALTDPDEIKLYDWGSYVIQRLVEAVGKLKADILRKVRVSNVTGCSLFLQVIYLDSMDLGIWNTSHSIQPRIRSFSSDRIRYMIDADSNIYDSGRLDVVYGMSQLRSPEEVCYGWASELRRVDAAEHKDEKSALWNDAVLMTRKLCIPTEVAGPVYLALAEHRRRISEVTLRQGRDLERAVASIIRPFLDGFNYRLDYDSTFWMLGQSFCRTPEVAAPENGICSNGCCGLCGIEHSSHDVESSCSDSIYSDGFGTSDRNRSFELHDPIAMEFIDKRKVDVGSVFRCGHVNEILCEEFNCGTLVEATVTKVMARVYLLSRKHKKTRSFDLNKEVQMADHTGTRVMCPVVDGKHKMQSPWDLGFSTLFDKDSLLRKLKILEQMTELDNTQLPWYVHHSPKFLEVKPNDARLQFLGGAELEMDMFDVLLRRFRQIDDSLYCSRVTPRWRHFVECDFLALLIAGWPRCFEISIRVQLTGCHLMYNVQFCQMLFFPLLLVHRWVCYAWRMEDNCIVVYDPCGIGGSVQQVDPTHEYVVTLLKRGMALASRKYFGSWHHDWLGASVEYIRAMGPPVPRNRSGVLVAYFCWSFNGREVGMELEQGGADAIAGLMLHESTQLLDNCGEVPDGLCM